MAETNQRPEINNFELEAAIADFRAEMHPVKFNKVLTLTQSAKFYCPATLNETPQAVEKEDGTVALEQKKDINLFCVSNKEGKRYIGVFTSPEQATNSEKAQELPSKNFAIMGILELHAFMLKAGENLDGIVINPFTTSFVVTKKLVNGMGETERFVPKPNEQVKIIGFSKYPDGFETAIKEYCDKDGRVNRIFLAAMERSNKARSLVAVVDHAEMSAGDRKQLFDGLAGCFTSFTQGMHLMFVPYGDDFSKTVTKDKTPCYEK